MTSFFVHRSNSLEVLADLLAELLSTPGDPMEPETIVVQSAGMQRWVSMRLAKQHGVCAHINFPFPVAFAYDLCRRLCPDLPQEYPMSQKRMLWYIAQQLQNQPLDSELKVLQGFVRDSSQLQNIQLAERIAYHFDQYLIFRPTWSRIWEKGQSSGDFQHPRLQAHAAWQSTLWRSLTRTMGKEHRAALMDQAIRILGQESAPGDLPARVYVFGIPTLPPIYLRLLQALSAHIPIHVFLLSPCQEYWADLMSSRHRQGLSRHQTLLVAEHPEDNTLLSSLGTVGKDFLKLLLEHDIQERELYVQPDSTTMLGQLQKDLLHLTTFSQSQDFMDHSIQVHCCHSPWREMEVLKNLVLDLLASDNTLKPQDILVMNPDIDVYAPIIQAVFGQSVDQIPFAIADRKPTRSAEAMSLFLELLELGLHRFEAPRICALLESEPMGQNLGLDAAQTQQILDWIKTSGVRWGLDASFRQQLGLGNYEQNTWTSGLSRLFLGYMVGESEPLNHIAPLALTSTSEQELLATLAAWIDDLSWLWTKVRSAQTGQQWREVMLWIVDNFFPQNQTLAPSLLTLRRVITELTENMGDLKADLHTMLYLMRQNLDETSGESGYLASGLTFCGPRPMRSIPFRVICLTGLGTAFPRQNSAPSFDLMAGNYRTGDRNLREDDRYLFLESIVSAQDKLILTYPGLSQKDNSEAPPSVLVSELLDFLDTNYLAQGDKPSKALVFKHKLQAFHPDYFTPNSGLFSYSQQNRAASQALFQSENAWSFFPQSSQVPAPEVQQEFSLKTLIRFFSHPCRYLLLAHKIIPAREEVLLLEEEPLTEPKGLDAYAPLQTLLDLALTRPKSNIRDLLMSWQILPPGQAGQEISQKLGLEIQTLARQIRQITKDAQAEQISIDLDLGAYRLTGHVPLYGQHLLTYRLATTKGKDILGLWILYLATLATGHVVQAQHMGKDQTFTLSRPADPLIPLKTLLDFFQRGQHSPLPFLPRTSWDFAQARFTSRSGQDRDQALQKAQKAWLGDGFQISPEKDDPYLSFLYQDMDPDWNDFMDIAEEVYGPILGGQP